MNINHPPELEVPQSLPKATKLGNVQVGLALSAPSAGMF